MSVGVSEVQFVLEYIRISGHHSNIVIIIKVRYAMSDVR